MDEKSLYIRPPSPLVGLSVFLLSLWEVYPYYLPGSSRGDIWSYSLMMVLLMVVVPDAAHLFRGRQNAGDQLRARTGLRHNGRSAAGGGSVRGIDAFHRDAKPRHRYIITGHWPVSPARSCSTPGTSCFHQRGRAAVCWRACRITWPLCPPCWAFPAVRRTVHPCQPDAVHPVLPGRRYGPVRHADVPEYRRPAAQHHRHRSGWGLLLGIVINMPNSYFYIVLFMAPLMLARYSFKLYLDSKSMHMRTIAALSMAVDAKDHYTQGHSRRVA